MAGRDGYRDSVNACLEKQVENSFYKAKECGFDLQRVDIL